MVDVIILLLLFIGIVIISIGTGFCGGILYESNRVKKFYYRIIFWYKREGKINKKLEKEMLRQ